jgi:hypothetical protein
MPEETSHEPQFDPLRPPTDPELDDTLMTFETTSGQRLKTSLGSSPRGEN